MAKITIKDGNTISYRLIGDKNKPTIIFTNGSIFNYKQFDPVLYPQLHKILGDSYSYLFYDYVGIGNSSEVDEFDYFRIARQHVELMDALDIDTAHHFGYSKGGAIIQLVAIEFPERVKSITILAGPNLAHWNHMIMDEFKERVEKMSTLYHLMDQRINEENYDEIYARLYQEMLFGEKLGFIDRIKNWYLKRVVKPMLIDTPVASLDKLYRYYTSELLDDKQQEEYMNNLKELEVPVLILHGTGDELVDMKGSEKLEQLISNCKLVKLEGVEHTTPAIIKKHGRLVMQEFADFVRNN